MTLKEAFNVLKQYIFYDNKDIPDVYTLAEAIEVVDKYKAEVEPQESEG